MSPLSISTTSMDKRNNLIHPSMFPKQYQSGVLKRCAHFSFTAMGSQGSKSHSKNYHFNYKSIKNPKPAYVPLESLTEPVIRSITSVLCSKRPESWNFSRRTVLAFALDLHEKLKEVEQSTPTNEHAIQIRQWLVDKQNEPFDWDYLLQQYQSLKKQKHDEMGRYFGVEDTSPYFELEMATGFSDVERSREYMAKFRKDGFQPEELKLYWNYEQIANLCPKDGTTEVPHDPSDIDAVENLRQHPVDQRNHSGRITYIHDGIEKAIFKVPHGAQIIVLNFANEQSPGGGYLRHAKAQEEVILYNSDAFRSLLDLKYGRMANGYAIPEYGLAYVRNIRFFDVHSDKHRQADMLVAACYCMSGGELYPNPTDREDWKQKNLAKFRAFIAAAVANTIGDGSNTYLLLGPIGTGAFANDVGRIGEVFRDVLNSEMMDSKKPIRKAFEHIWFVSTEKEKNDRFEKIIVEPTSEPKNTEN